MSFPFDVKEMEKGNFRDAGDRKTKRAVEIENSPSSPIPVSTLGVSWDSLQVQFPANNQDLWKYYKNSTQVLEILVTYEDSTKRQIVGIQREVF